MLNQHSKLFLPSEQYFLGGSIIKYKLYNFLIWRDLMKIIGGELVHTTGSHTWKCGAEAILPDLFNIEKRCLQNVIDKIYRCYAAELSMDKMYWGDSTPPNTAYIQEIFSVFPKARYIFMIRDGRDVASAYKKGGSEFGSLADPVYAAIHWNKSIDAYKWLCRKVAKVELISYENLVRNSVKELKSVCSFLDVDYEQEMMNYHTAIPDVNIYKELRHANLFKQVSDSSVGQWKTLLSPEEIRKIELIIKENLIRFGYE